MAEGETEVASGLSVILQHALSGINQYFLHARILKHLGFMKLADHEYKESIHEMRQADQLVERILALGGVPHPKHIGQLDIEENVGAIVRADLALERRAHAALLPVLGLSERCGDEASARLLSAMQKNEEAHIAFLEAQLGLVESLGEDAYLQTQT